MLGGLQNFLLKRKAKKSKRKVQVHNLGSAKSALLLYTFKDELREKQIRDFARFLKEEGIKTTSIAFIAKKMKDESKLPKEELTYFYFDKKEVSWLTIPNSTRLKKLMRADFDLLIDLNLEESFPLQWISTLSKASFKVGNEKGYHAESCDLLLGTKENTIVALQDQCKLYLNMINRNNAK